MKKLLFVTTLLFPNPEKGLLSEASEQVTSNELRGYQKRLLGFLTEIHDLEVNFVDLEESAKQADNQIAIISRELSELTNQISDTCSSSETFSDMASQLAAQRDQIPQYKEAHTAQLHDQKALILSVKKEANELLEEAKELAPDADETSNTKNDQFPNKGLILATLAVLVAALLELRKLHRKKQALERREQHFVTTISNNSQEDNNNPNDRATLQAS